MTALTSERRAELRAPWKLLALLDALDAAERALAEERAHTAETLPELQQLDAVRLMLGLRNDEDPRPALRALFEERDAAEARAKAAEAYAKECETAAARACLMVIKKERPTND